VDADLSTHCILHTPADHYEWGSTKG